MIPSIAECAQAFNQRYAGTLDSLSASAETGTLDSVQAMGVKSFADVSSKLVYVRLTQHVFVNFETQRAGEILQLKEFDAKYLVNTNKAVFVSDEEVAEAQKAK